MTYLVDCICFHSHGFFHPFLAGVVSAGPGAAYANRKQPAIGENVEIKMAEYTPDGRKIIATGTCIRV